MRPEPVRIERHRDVMVLIAGTLLDAPARAALESAIKEAVADGSIAAVVIRGDDGGFFAGGDARGAPDAPALGMLANIVEASDKPVVAALGGHVAGPAFALALACHYRVAAPGAELSLPEVREGRLPGAGATQRLPRIAGMALALAMAAGGEPVGAEDAHAAGLVDRVVGADSLAADALAFAGDIKARRPTPRASEREVAADPAAVDSFRQRHADPSPALAAALACVCAAAELPFADGLALELAEAARLRPHAA